LGLKPDLLASVADEVGLHQIRAIEVFVTANDPLRFFLRLKIICRENTGPRRISPRPKDFSRIDQILICKDVARVGLWIASGRDSIRQRRKEVPVLEVKNSPADVEPMGVSIDKARNNDVAAQVKNLGS